MADDLAWTFELSAEAIRIVRRELEWALQHQRDRLVRRLPQNKVALRTRQRVVVVAAIVLLAASGWLWTLERGQPSTLVIGGVVIAAVALVLVPFMPRYFAWTYRAIGRRIARRAETILAPLASEEPTTARYELHGDRLAIRYGEQPGDPLELDEVHAAVATAHAVFAFRWPSSPFPLATVFVPSSPHPIVAELERRGIAMARVDGPVARYGEWTALPTATAR
ncbi:MAG TPA: hypothetical protein VMJ10_05930 [Kofleriaceae bacterium]|nr:hypothetical protein [Kofleriaceae bacterium]